MQPGFRWLFPVPSSPLYMLQPSYRPRVFLESMGISSNSPQRCCSEAGPLRDLEDGTTKMSEMQAEGDPPPSCLPTHHLMETVWFMEQPVRFTSSAEKSTQENLHLC